MSEKVYLDKVLLNAYKFNTNAVDNSIAFYSSNKFIRDSEWEDAIRYLNKLRDVISENTIDVIKRKDSPQSNNTTRKTSSHTDLMDGLYQHMDELSYRSDDDAIKNHIQSLIDIFEKDNREL